MEDMNILDVLLDAENEDPIILYTEENEAVAFDQEAVIPYKESLYCILVPQDPAAMGVGEDEAIVFQVIADAEEPYLEIETDDAVIDGVFALYEQLLAEEEE